MFPFKFIAAAKVGLMLVCGFGVLAMSDSFPTLPGQDPWSGRPNDPDYRKQWQLFSHIPKDHRGELDPWDEKHGSGLSADKSWQLHIGDPDTVIAVLDSGIRWREKDLIERHRLNRKELPLPQGSSSYDVNRDGRFSIADYQGDPRVFDANNNGRIEPGDLIAAFSDGKDQDNNGFVDDIAGWDFHEHDNDPHDRTDFGHGTGEAEDSVAAINNGIDGAGICGNCSLMSIRLNDSFVVDAHAFARAVVYAVDSGANVIQQALGAVNGSDQVREALNYAYKKGVVVIGSAADENSYHHNFPSTYDPVVYPNAIRYDSKDRRDASTFINFNNCSNFGARVDVSVPAKSCSSEATGKLAGVVGLVYSYSKQLGQPLHPGEMISLIKSTSDDINRGSNENDPSRHASYLGWDAISGYGRVNAWSMMKQIKLNKIPPAARITSPHWFDVLPRSKAEVEIRVSIPKPRGVTWEAKLEVARGVETSGSQFTTIRQKNGQGRFDGVFAKIDRSELGQLKPSLREEYYNERAYTLRLTVRGQNGLVGEARRTFFLLAKDPSLHAGFPVRLPGSSESSGLFVDLNGDGAEEYVTADGSGQISATAFNQRPVGEFPFQGVASRYHSMASPVKASIFAAIAAGDVDGDGQPDIVAATMEGHVIALNHKGRLKKGFPVLLPFPDMARAGKDQNIAQGVYASPVLADISGNGELDIVIATLDSKVYVFDGHGQPLPGFPVTIESGGQQSRILSSPSVVDLDRDGRLDIIFGTNHQGAQAGFLFAIDRQGQPLKGFPRRIPTIRDKVLPTVGTGVPTSPVVADFDNDQEYEIFIHAFVGKAYLVSADGTLEKSFGLKPGRRSRVGDDFMIPAFGHPALAKFGDGQLRPTTVGAGERFLVATAIGGKRVSYDHMVGAWDVKTGAMNKQFPFRIDDMAISSSLISFDYDGDGSEEVVAGSSGYFVRGYDAARGKEAFDKFTGGWILATPSVGDFDGDGRLDLAASTREGFVFIWKTKATTLGSWPTFRGNNARTGVLKRSSK